VLSLRKIIIYRSVYEKGIFADKTFPAYRNFSIPKIMGNLVSKDGMHNECA
jgi:hypothetical protein